MRCNLYLEGTSINHIIKGYFTISTKPSTHINRFPIKYAWRIEICQLFYLPIPTVLPALTILLCVK